MDGTNTVAVAMNADPAKKQPFHRIIACFVRLGLEQDSELRPIAAGTNVRWSEAKRSPNAACTEQSYSKPADVDHG